MTPTDFPGITFLNIKNLDTFLEEKPVLYKYMPLEHALSTLENKSFWLSDPCEWIDPFEKFFLKAKYLTPGGDSIDFPFLGRTFATCITHERHSEAQWITYSENSIAIRFDIDTFKFLEQLSKYAIKNSNKVYFGQVEYHKRDEIMKHDLNEIIFKEENGTLNRNIKDFGFCARLLLLKRIDFSYENEFRIIVCKKNKVKSKGINFEYNCENKELIRSLTVTPKIKDHTMEMLRNYLSNTFDMQPKSDKLGRLQPRVLRSRLYDEVNNTEISIE